ncbi:hypothetical protein [Bradyrhizobium sp. B117]|uniref:hypothetical protein n=1 Tax=Bradyrhizobium sp. B117 TaxID=3140246 RepID=UPI0031840E83
MWLALSAPWVPGTFAFFAVANSALILPEAFVMKDATSGFFKLDNFFDQFNASFKAAHKSIEFPNSVTLFVVNGIPDAVLKAKANEFYKTYSEPRSGELWSARVDYWMKAALAALGPPLAVLALGSLIGWIFAGFARD